MHISFVEIANFRKLLSTRVDLSEKTTLFVGANNSGKSSAMLALRRFLVPQRCPFELHDFTLCHWPSIDAIGQSWINANQANEIVSLDIAVGVPTAHFGSMAQCGFRRNASGSRSDSDPRLGRRSTWRPLALRA
ncbi:AAA family ATPase [Bradyrhizobium sp. UFLA05-153]